MMQQKWIVSKTKVKSKVKERKTTSKKKKPKVLEMSSKEVNNPVKEVYKVMKLITKNNNNNKCNHRSLR